MKSNTKDTDPVGVVRVVLHLASIGVAACYLLGVWSDALEGVERAFVCVEGLFSIVELARQRSR